MSGMTARFIGGNGAISAAASRLAVERGIEVTLLTLLVARLTAERRWCAGRERAE
jgi:hypothetical protein